MTTDREPNQIAQRVAQQLEQTDNRLVLAESCSGGMAAAIMTQVPGISKHFCGSVVSYREKSKQAWLDVSADTLREFTAESQPTTDELASNVLRSTTEATISAAITGHLGPTADAKTDGLIFVAVAKRFGTKIEIVVRAELRLISSTRVERQIESALFLLTRVSDSL